MNFDRGRITTIISDLALVAGAVYAAHGLTPDLVTQIIVIAGAIVIAGLDVFYPEAASAPLEDTGTA